MVYVVSVVHTIVRRKETYGSKYTYIELLFLRKALFACFIRPLADELRGTDYRRLLVQKLHELLHCLSERHEHHDARVISALTSFRLDGTGVLVWHPCAEVVEDEHLELLLLRVSRETYASLEFQLAHDSLKVRVVHELVIA